MAPAVLIDDSVLLWDGLWMSWIRLLDRVERSSDGLHDNVQRKGMSIGPVCLLGILAIEVAYHVGGWFTLQWFMAARKIRIGYVHL